jgi:hypothetical protein
MQQTCSRNSSIERFKKSISDTLARIVWFSDVSVSITATSVGIVIVATRSQTLVLLGNLHIQLLDLGIKHHLHLVQVLAQLVDRLVDVRSNITDRPAKQSPSSQPAA